MTIAVALLVFALGAILRFAVSADVSGVDLHMIGVILMIVGAVGFVIALIVRFTRRRTEVISRIDDGMGPRETRTSYLSPTDPDDRI